MGLESVWRLWGIDKYCRWRESNIDSSDVQCVAKAVDWRRGFKTGNGGALVEWFSYLCWDSSCKTESSHFGNYQQVRLGGGGFFHVFLFCSLTSCSYGPGVDSASNRNEYQEYFLGVRTVGAYGWQPYHLHVLIVLKSGSLNLLERSGPVQACTGVALPLLLLLVHRLENLFQRSVRKTVLKYTASCLRGTFKNCGSNSTSAAVETVCGSSHRL